MSFFWRYLRLPIGDKARILIAVVLLVVNRAGLRTIGFSRLRNVLVSISNVSANVVPGSPTPERIAWCVFVADNYIPSNRTCLMQSLATEVMLRMYGYVPEHRIGVSKGEDESVVAHSWIEYDGEVLVGDHEDISRFNPLPPLDRSEGE